HAGVILFFFSSRRRHTRFSRDWSSDVCSSDLAGLGLIIGLAGALWTASGYVGAFMRASNSIYEIEEGRPFWKLRPLQILVTLVRSEERRVGKESRNGSGGERLEEEHGMS